jgi:putative hydrolase of the HAD superfamily
MIKAIIFDCFGVLVGKGFEQTYRIAGGDPVRDRDFIEKTLGEANLGLITDEQFRIRMAERVGITKVEWDEALRQAELVDMALLAYILQLRSSYKTAVLSNANKHVLNNKIGDEWLEKAFDEVVVSAEVGLVKPDPRMYQLVADRLGVVPKECIYIDDRESFVKIASEMGMNALIYSNFSQLKDDIAAILG